MLYTAIFFYIPYTHKKVTYFSVPRHVLKFIIAVITFFSFCGYWCELNPLLPKSTWWNHNLQWDALGMCGEAVGRWLGREHRALIMGSGPLLEGTREILPPLSSLSVITGSRPCWKCCPYLLSNSHYLLCSDCDSCCPIGTECAHFPKITLPNTVCLLPLPGLSFKAAMG